VNYLHTEIVVIISEIKAGQNLPSRPLVSVIMGVFNRQQFLAEAIESVLNQTLPDFEVILVNDGSTDRSLEILGLYAQRDSRIIVISSEANRGIARSLNVGISRARAEYLAVMDSDDVALPGRLETELNYFKAHDEIALLGSHAKLVDSRGAEIRAEVDLPPDHHDIDDALLAGGWPIIHPTVMMRTSVIQALGGYNERFRSNVDHELFLRVAEKWKLANLQDVLLLYRVHHQAMTAQRSRMDHRVVQQTIIREACERRSLPYPPQIIPRNRGLSFHQAYWQTGVRGGRQLIRLLFRSPRAFCGQLLLTVRRSTRLRRLLRPQSRCF